MNASQVETTIHSVREVFISFLQERIDRMGLTESGAYNYYSERLREGLILKDYEKALILYLTAQPRDCKWHLVHVGVGLGPLALAVAALGYPVLGFEGDRKRYKGASDACSLLSRHFPTIATQYDLRHGFYPDGFNDGDVRSGYDNILLFTKAASTYNMEHEDELLRSFSRFNEVIFSPQYFTKSQAADVEQQKLLTRASTYLNNRATFLLADQESTWFSLKP